MSVNSDPFVNEKGHIRPLHEIERDAIVRALEHYNGRRETAAQWLGVAKSTFYRKLHDHGLMKPKPKKRVLRPRVNH